MEKKSTDQADESQSVFEASSVHVFLDLDTLQAESNVNLSNDKKTIIKSIDFLQKTKVEKIFVPKTRDDCYFKNYPNFEFFEGKIADLSNTLINTKIDNSVRAKMVDWIMEVLGHFQSELSYQTFFRSIFIMDHFLKYTSIQLTNEHIHLIGLTSMYIASKYEDIFHIRITDFSRRAAHDKYSTDQIRETEMIILMSCGYCISYKTFSEIIDVYFFKFFNFKNKVLCEQVKSITLLFLLFCSIDCYFNNYDSRLIVVSTVLVALKYLKNSYLLFSQGFKKEAFSLIKEIKEYDQFIRDFIKNDAHFALVESKLKTIFAEMIKFLVDFEEKYPNCHQPLKQGQFNKRFLLN